MVKQSIKNSLSIRPWATHKRTPQIDVYTDYDYHSIGTNLQGMGVYCGNNFLKNVVPELLYEIHAFVDGGMVTYIYNVKRGYYVVSKISHSCSGEFVETHSFPLYLTKKEMLNKRFHGISDIGIVWIDLRK